jgi:vitamin B12 transporter
VRTDFGNDTDTEWTPRVGASFRVPRVPVTFRGSWGQGFKLPAFFSLSDPLIGNRDLDVEKSVGWDVGADVVFWDRRVRLNVTYFEIRVKDLIDFDFASFQLVNRDRVSSKGVEIGFGADLPWNLSLSGSVTRARTKIRNSSARLRRRPGWRASGGLRWSPHERASVGLDALWVGSVHDESNPTGPVKLGDYVRFDARGEVRVWRDVSVYLAIDNLFDESYQEAVGVPAMGIRPRAGVRAVF